MVRQITSASGGALPSACVDAMKMMRSCTQHQHRGQAHDQEEWGGRQYPVPTLLPRHTHTYIHTYSGQQGEGGGEGEKRTSEGRSSRS